MDRHEVLSKVNTVVIKVGTSSITGGTNTVSTEFMDSVAEQVRRIRDMGKKVLIVTSGAIGVGLGAMNAKPKPKEVPIRQAAASVGQSILMQKWSDSFQKQGIVIAQILLTLDFYSDREKYLNLRNAIETLMSYDVVPIINENDVICVKEIDAMFGDNDTLSAYVSSKMDADLLIILSDVDGLYDSNPKIHPDAKLISVVDHLDDSIMAMAGDPTTRLGVGGMKTKLRAAEICSESGCNMIIANSTVPDVIVKAVGGEDIGTLFLSHGATSKKSLWIKAAHSSGTIYIDEGGAKALKKHMSLLAVGIRDVVGRFDKGDVVDIVCNGELIAKGIPDYNSEETFKIRGLHSDRVMEVLGHKTYDDVVRSENIVLIK